MLSIDRKKTDRLDLTKPLQQYVRNQYSAEVLQEHMDAINGLNQLREDVRNTQDKGEISKDLLWKYYQFVLSMEMRFPIGENNIRLQFTWVDIFKGKKVYTYSIYYEKAALLFNIGATYSQMGSVTNRSTADGLKSACQSFQIAAGIFEKLKDEVERHPQANVPDLTPEAVNFLHFVMLAQAQECFYERAVKDNMKHAIVSKLAAQVGDYYELANNVLTNHQTLAQIVPKNWQPHVQLKAGLYKAVAHFRQSSAHLEADQYGSQVSRLQSAIRILDDLKKRLLKSVGPDVQTLFNTIQAQITRAHEAAEKENDTIYHDSVPAENKLPALEKKSMVKAIPIAETYQPAGPDPFVKLIPYLVYQKLSVYQERKDSLVRNLLKNIDDNNQLALGTLSSMNLPGAIEALETPVGVPQSIMEKSNTMRKEGGARMILELVDTLTKLAEEDLSILDRAAKKLDGEERDDNEMRQQHGARWQRTPSHTLTMNLRQEANKFKGNVEHARKSDSFVLKKFQDHQQYIVKLSGTQDDISALLPSHKDSGLGNHPSVLGLKDSLGQLDRLIAERNALRSQLTTLSQNDDIAGSLMNATKTDEEVYSDELQKYQEIGARLEATFGAQANLLSQIQSQNAGFMSIKQSDTSGAAREQVLQQLNNAFKVYTDLKNNLREGIQFYTNFQEILKQFATKCEDFVLARETEKQDHLSDLQRPAPTIPQGNQPPLYQQPGAMPGAYQPNMKPTYAPPPSQPQQPQPQPPRQPQQPPQQPQAYQGQPPSYGTPYGQQPQFQQPPPGYYAYQPQPGHPQPPPQQAPYYGQPQFQQPPPGGFQQPPPGYPYGHQQPPPQQAPYYGQPQYQPPPGGFQQQPYKK